MYSSSLVLVPQKQQQEWWYEQFDDEMAELLRDDELVLLEAADRQRNLIGEATDATNSSTTGSERELQEDDQQRWIELKNQLENAGNFIRIGKGRSRAVPCLCVVLQAKLSSTLHNFRLTCV